MAGWTINDLEPPFEGTVKDGAVPVNLSTAVGIEIHIKRPDTTIITRAGVVAPDQAITPGAWTLPLVTGDLTVTGKYLIEVEVEWTVGRNQTFGPTTFTVTGEIA